MALLCIPLLLGASCIVLVELSDANGGEARWECASSVRLFLTPRPQGHAPELVNLKGGVETEVVVGEPLGREFVF